MDNYNKLVRITFNSESVTTYETFDVKELRETINKIFTDFKDKELIELIKTEPEIYDLFYPINNKDKNGFPIAYISPGRFREYEVRYTQDSLINYPTLKNIIDSAISKLQHSMLEKWNQELLAIGFL